MMQKTATTGKSGWLTVYHMLSEATLTLITVVINRADTG